MELNLNTLISIANSLYYQQSQDPIFKNKVLIISSETSGNIIINKNSVKFKIIDQLRNENDLSISKLMSHFNLEFSELSDDVIDLFKKGLIALDKNVFAPNSARINKYKLIKPISDPNVHPVLCIFHMHNFCNLACKYCYTIDSKSSKRRISVDLMKKAVIEFSLLNANVTTFEFHGGEPTMAFQEIQIIVNYVKDIYQKIGKKYNFSIQTNAYALNEEVIKFFVDNEFLVRISMDGTEETHNSFRHTNRGTGSYDKVKKGILALIANKIDPGFVCVVHKGNYLKLIEMHKSMSDLGARSVRYLPMFKSNIGNNELWLEGKIFLNVYFELIKYIIKERKEGRDIAILPNLNLGEISNIESMSRNYMCMRSPCGAGRNMIGIDIDGGIYPCEEMIGNSIFKIGDLSKSSILEALNHNTNLTLLKRHVDEIEKCKTCPWKQFCHGGCVQKSHAYYGNIYQESEYCDYYKQIYSKLLWLREQEPNAFSYLKGKLNKLGAV
jgi:uncharacterized protein